MKVFKYILLLCFTCSSVVSSSQTHRDKKNFSFDMTSYEKIHVYNTGGDVIVNGVSGVDAKLEVQRQIEATSNKKLNRAIAEMFVDTMVVDGELFVFISSPYEALDNTGNGRYLDYVSRFGGRNNYSAIKKSGIKSKFDFTINLPKETDAVISTRKGELKVDGVLGDIAALNHHSDVHLTSVRNVHYVTSHHGDLKVEFVEQPNNDIAFSTHHGDIEISFPKTPSAQVEFDSYHGEFYTDFEWTTGEPRLEKVNNKSKRKTTYTLADKTIVSMGSAAQRLSFDSHHGDFYILKN